MKICPVEAELYHADGQKKLIVASHNFAKAPKNHKKSHELGLIKPQT